MATATATPQLAAALEARNDHTEGCLRCNRGPHTWLDCPTRAALDDLVEYEENRVQETLDQEALSARAFAEDPELATAKAVAQELSLRGRDATAAWDRYQRLLDDRALTAMETQDHADAIELGRPVD